MGSQRKAWAVIAFVIAITGCDGDDDDKCSPGIASSLLGNNEKASNNASDSDACAATTTTSSAVAQAADSYAEAVCGCLDVPIDQCTETTAAERSCQYAEASKVTGAAATWRDCSVAEMKRVTSCINRSNTCSNQILNDCVGGEEDPIESACGPQPADLDRIDEMCEGKSAGQSPGEDADQSDDDTPDTDDDGSAGSDAEDGGGSGDGVIACDDGKPIEVGWICDGEADCAGGEDESPEICQASVTCPDGTPLEFEWICDGEADCASGEDEANCTPHGA